MAQGSTTFPTTLDSARSNPSNMDTSEAAMLAMQAKIGADSSTVAASLDYKSRQKEIALYAADGAISIDSHKAHVLTKAGVGAYTLAAPTAAQAGQMLVIVNGTANAHVLTATNLLDDGVTGGAKDTATFAAFVGSSLTLMAYNLKWVVVSNNIVTIAAV
jgi:hypothetical protein